MFYNLIMIQWYNKSLCDWSCSFSDMSIIFVGTVISLSLFFQKRKIKVMIKNHTTGRNCQAVILYDSQFTHTIERNRETEKGRGERDRISMFWRLVRDGDGHQFIVRRRQAQDIFCTFCNLNSYSARPSTCMKAHFHSCVLRVWPDPAAAHPPIADGGWAKAIWPPAPFRVNPDICWFTWGCHRDQDQQNNL